MPRLQVFGVPLAEMAKPASTIDQAIADARRVEVTRDRMLASQPIIENPVVPSMASVRLPELSAMLIEAKGRGA